jgi:6-phosphogluconolactonase
MCLPCARDTWRHWRSPPLIGDNRFAMETFSRRDFLVTASAATVAVSVSPSFAAARRQRVLVGSNTPNGILAYDWDPATAALAPVGVAAKLANVDWITRFPGRDFLYAASEVDSFNGKATGEVASFKIAKDTLQPLSAQNSASVGTCHVALDHTGRVLLSAHYTGHGPNTERQQTAHAHFASFSPNNKFAYINDLGSDCIHIYGLNAETAELTSAGAYVAKPGAGPRTLHFHPNGHAAYSINELDSTVDLLEWNKSDGSLTPKKRIDLLPEGYHGPTGACDTVISKDGKTVYFANRINDFIYGFHADPVTGALTPIGRFSCGGKIPRNFVLDPTERWMLVANQESNYISVFARDPKTGELAKEGKNYPAAAPMCILFV